MQINLFAIVTCNNENIKQRKEKKKLNHFYSSFSYITNVKITKNGKGKKYKVQIILIVLVDNILENVNSYDDLWQSLCLSWFLYYKNQYMFILQCRKIVIFWLMLMCNSRWASLTQILLWKCRKNGWWQHFYFISGWTTF